MKQIKFKRLDFATGDFTKTTALLWPDSVADEKEYALITIQRPAIESAYYHILFSAFLNRKGLMREFAEFKDNSNEVRKNFDGTKMQAEYLEELERLEELYETLLSKVNKTNSYRLGDKVWYLDADNEKYSAVIQSYITYDGTDHFVDIDFNGKLVKDVSLDRISTRW